jgi:hypothetical protein
MDKKRKAKGILPSKGWDRTGARIERKEETMPKVFKLSIREKKRSRVSYHSSPRLFPRLNNSWQEGRAESEYREAETHDIFPYFLS